MLRDLPETGDFYTTLKNALVHNGYSAHEGGIFTKKVTDSSSNWISVSGNQYFYSVNVGVVFLEIAARLAQTIPVTKGMNRLDNIPPELIPLVFAPLGRYLPVPARGTDIGDGTPLSSKDAADLADLLCAPLQVKLSKFHNLDSAADEASATIGSGNLKSYLLVIAYQHLNKKELAEASAKSSLSEIRSDAAREFYLTFLKNVGISPF